MATPAAPSVLVYSMYNCADCKRSKALLHRLGVAYTEINVEDEPEAAKEVIRLNNGKRLLPTIIIDGREVLTEPSDGELQAALEARSPASLSPPPLSLFSGPVRIRPTGRTGLFTTSPLADTHPLTRVSPYEVWRLPPTIWRRRELLVHLVVRNLRSLYKQSIIGYAWLIVNPIAQTAIYSFIFATVLGTPSQGYPFLVFLLVGLVPWIFFSTAVTAATDSISGATGLVTMVYFPRELLVTAAVLTKLADFGGSAIILICLLIYYSIDISLSVLWVPVIFIIQLAFTLGLSLPLAALNVYFRDVRFLVGVGLNLLFFLTPVMYPSDIVPGNYQFLYDLNPNARFVNAYRNAILAEVSPPLETLLPAVLMSFGTLIVGYYLFKKMEWAFADRL